MKPKLSSRLAARVGALVASLILGWAAIWSCRTVVSDEYAAHDNYAAAARFRPDVGDWYREQAQRAEGEDLAVAQRQTQLSLHISPNDWRNWSQAALVAFEQGDLPRAQADYLEAARLNAGFLSHLQLASYSLVTGDMRRFWPALARALRMAPADQIAGVLQTGLAAGTADADRLQALVPVDDAATTAVAIQYLADHDLAAPAVTLWNRSPCPRATDPVCRAAGLDLVAKLIPWPAASTASWQQSDDVRLSQAMAVWNQLVRLHLTDAASIRTGYLEPNAWTDSTVGPDFSWELFSEIPEQIIRPVGTESYVEFSFDGREADHVQLAAIVLPVRSQTDYQLTMRIRGSTGEQGGDIQLQARINDNDPILAQITAPLSPAWHTCTLRIPASRVHLLEIKLEANRSVGEVRLQFPVDISAIYLTPVKQ